MAVPSPPVMGRPLDSARSQTAVLDCGPLSKVTAAGQQAPLAASGVAGRFPLSASAQHQATPSSSVSTPHTVSSTGSMLLTVGGGTATLRALPKPSVRSSPPVRSMRRLAVTVRPPPISRASPSAEAQPADSPGPSGRRVSPTQSQKQLGGALVHSSLRRRAPVRTMSAQKTSSAQEVSARGLRHPNEVSNSLSATAARQAVSTPCLQPWLSDVTVVGQPSATGQPAQPAVSPVSSPVNQLRRLPTAPTARPGSGAQVAQATSPPAGASSSQQAGQQTLQQQPGQQHQGLSEENQQQPPQQQPTAEPPSQSAPEPQSPPQSQPVSQQQQHQQQQHPEVQQQQPQPQPQAQEQPQPQPPTQPQPQPQTQPQTQPQPQLQPQSTMQVLPQSAAASTDVPKQAANSSPTRVATPSPAPAARPTLPSPTACQFIHTPGHTPGRANRSTSEVSSLSSTLRHLVPADGVSPLATVRSLQYSSRGLRMSTPSGPPSVHSPVQAHGDQNLVQLYSARSAISTAGSGGGSASAGSPLATARTQYSGRSLLSARSPMGTARSAGSRLFASPQQQQFQQQMQSILPAPFVPLEPIAASPLAPPPRSPLAIPLPPIAGSLATDFRDNRAPSRDFAALLQAQGPFVFQRLDPSPTPPPEAHTQQQHSELVFRTFEDSLDKTRKSIHLADEKQARVDLSPKGTARSVPPVSARVLPPPNTTSTGPSVAANPEVAALIAASVRDGLAPEEIVRRHASDKYLKATAVKHYLVEHDERAPKPGGSSAVQRRLSAQQEARNGRRSDRSAVQRRSSAPPGYARGESPDSKPTVRFARVAKAADGEDCVDVMKPRESEDVELLVAQSASPLQQRQQQHQVAPPLSPASRLRTASAERLRDSSLVRTASEERLHEVSVVRSVSAERLRERSITRTVSAEGLRTMTPSVVVTTAANLVQPGQHREASPVRPPQQLVHWQFRAPAPSPPLPMRDNLVSTWVLPTSPVERMPSATLHPQPRLGMQSGMQAASPPSPAAVSVLQRAASPPLHEIAINRMTSASSLYQGAHPVPAGAVNVHAARQLPSSPPQPCRDAASPLLRTRHPLQHTLPDKFMPFHRHEIGAVDFAPMRNASSAQMPAWRRSREPQVSLA